MRPLDATQHQRQPNSMQILAVSSWFPYPPDNGSKLRVYYLLSHLARHHSIRLLTFAEPGEEEGLSGLSTICESVTIVRGNPFKPQAPLAVTDLFGAVPRSYRQTYSDEMQASVDAAIASSDAVIAFQLGAALYLARHRSKPCVFEEAETTVIRERFHGKPFGPDKLRAGLTWWKYARFVRGNVAAFDRTTVVSEMERQHLLKLGCEPAFVHVVPNGVDEAALLEPNKPRAGQMIYSGSITYAPNHEAVRYFVAEILPRIQAVRPDAFVKVTGETAGVDLSPFVHPSVIFTGRVPDVRAEVAQSAVSVVPLKNGGGTRLKILEALALGTPVVSTAKGAEGLDVTNGHDILIADSPQAFAAHVVRLHEDPSLRQRIAANGRQLISRRYTWNKIGSELDQVLQEAIDGHAASRAAVAAGSPQLA